MRPWTTAKSCCTRRRLSSVIEYGDSQTAKRLLILLRCGPAGLCHDLQDGNDLSAVFLCSFHSKSLWLCSGIEDSSKGSSACASAVHSEAWPATAKPSPRTHWGSGRKKIRVIGVLHCRGRLPFSGHHRLWWSELWFSRSVRTSAWFLHEHGQTVPLQSCLFSGRNTRTPSTLVIVPFDAVAS